MGGPRPIGPVCAADRLRLPGQGQPRTPAPHAVVTQALEVAMGCLRASGAGESEVFVVKRARTCLCRLWRRFPPTSRGRRVRTSLFTCPVRLLAGLLPECSRPSAPSGIGRSTDIPARKMLSANDGCRWPATSQGCFAARGGPCRSRCDAGADDGGGCVGKRRPRPVGEGNAWKLVAVGTSGSLAGWTVTTTLGGRSYRPARGEDHRAGAGRCWSGGEPAGRRSWPGGGLVVRCPRGRAWRTPKGWKAHHR